MTGPECTCLPHIRDDLTVTGFTLDPACPRHGSADEVLLRVTRAIHDVDCPAGPGCGDDLTTYGRYGRYAQAALAALDADPEHIIELRTDGWTIQHPLACRLSGELFSCPFNRAAEGLGPMDRLGRYVCHLVDGRVAVGAQRETR